MSVRGKTVMWVAGVALTAFVWAAYTQPSLQIALQSAFAMCAGWVR